MALNKPWSKDLFSQAWVDNLSGSIERAMPATVKFYDPTVSSAVYDPVSNTYTSAPLILLTSAARVQPLRSAAQKDSTGDATSVQSVLVSIPIALGKTLDLRPKHRAQITVSPFFPVLVNYVFVAKEVLDSSNPIERTFIFEVNQEVVQS